jgi:nucleoid-associated protein YgaU
MRGSDVNSTPWFAPQEDLGQRSLLLPACTGTHPLTRRLLQTCTVKYTIKPGDGLDAIATKFKTTRAAIMAANPSITNADEIQAGQVISIPNQPCTGKTSQPKAGRWAMHRQHS